MFSLSYFNASPLSLRIQTVFSEGSFIDSNIISDKVKIALYSLHTFYVEVYYDRVVNEVSDAKGISVDETLEKYPDLVV